MAKEIQVKCCFCDKSFDRNSSEVKRNIKRGRQIFCSRSCHAKNIVKESGSRLGDKLGVIGPNFYRKKDDLSDFNRYYANIKKRCILFGRELEITKQDLKSQWLKQNGICPYTGWELLHPSDGKNKVAKQPRTASVDRINSGLGYTKDNIEFVALIVQYAKNDWDVSVVQELGQAIVAHGKLP